jgi:hypothetical protein
MARRAQQKWRLAHPKEERDNKKRWRAANPERNREANRAQKIGAKYGITVEQRDALLVSQGGVCAICRGDNSYCKHNWSIDHCHETGKVRGILCGRCNTGLGQFKDSVETLLAAARYLEKSRD